MARLTSAEQRLVLDWGVSQRALAGERESGDRYVVSATDAGALVAVVDGLGHGSEAAAAATRAVEVLEQSAAERPEAALSRCHDALQHTRGAVVTLASLDADTETLTWLGVGNVEGLLVRERPAAGSPYEIAPLHPGIVGFRLPALRPAVVALRRGDLIVLASDGVDLDLDRPPGGREPVQVLADRILAESAVGTDDALVVVARYRGRAR